jgi:peptidoglycan/LPS O-acetylase OafA/YrhL
MRNLKIWPYLRILFALPFTFGVFIAVFAFISLTDDFGNPIYQSTPSRVGQFIVGVSMLVFSVYIAVPNLLRRKREARPSGTD